MLLSTRSLPLVGPGLLAFAAACQPVAQDDCARGSLACTCQPDGSCDFGLQCEGTICVSPGATTDEASSEEGSSDDGTTAPPSPSSSSTSAPPPSCGDGSCDPDEACAWCPEDCGECPASCGDDVCDPQESCASCVDDCGECCGDGSCDAKFDEDWIACWNDCSDEAPMVPLSGLYGACDGASTLFDDDPSSDWLWVRTDTLALMYVDGDEVVEISGTTLVDGNVMLDGEYFGTVRCHQSEDDACAPAIVRMAPGAGCNAAFAVADFTREGNAISVDHGEGFSPCSTLCGNGSCDPHETQNDCYANIEHWCSDDCGEYDGPCETCVD